MARVLRRVLIGVLAFIVLCFIAAFFVLRSRTFHRYVLTQMVERAEQATGSKVQIGDFTFRLSGLRLDFYRIAIFGTGSKREQPLLWVDHAGVNLRIVSVLERKVDLASVVIDHPIVHLVIEASGQSNLPRPATSKARSKSGKLGAAFKVTVGHLRINRGEVNFNDRKIRLRADLRHVRAEASYNRAKKEYDGSAGYRAGEIQLGAFQPLRHSFSVQFTARPDEMQVNSLVVSAGASRIVTQAIVRNYAHPRVNGVYSVVLSVSQIARVMKSAAVPAGVIRTRGSFSYRDVSGRPLLDSVSLHGHISSPGLTLRWHGVHGEFAAVTGAYRIDGGSLAAPALQAKFAGGTVKADLAIHRLSREARGTLALTMQSLSLGSFRGAISNSRWAALPVSGTLDATAEAEWHGRFAGLRIRSDATVDASLARAQAANGNSPIPLQGTIHAAYDAPAGILTLQQTVLRTPASEVDLNGTLGTLASLAVSARSSDLREMDLLITNIRQLLSKTASPIRRIGLAGVASFQGAVQGRLQNPTLAGNLRAPRVEIRHVEFTHLKTQVRLATSEILINGGQVQAAQGWIQFQASLGLQRWAYNSSAPLAVRLIATNVHLAAVEPLANWQYPVSGILSARVSMRGSVRHPTGAGTVEIVKAEAWKQPIQKVTANFQGTAGTVYTEIAVETSAGNATANVTYLPETQTFSGNMNMPRLRLQQFEALQHGRLQINGVVTASLSGHGTLKSPNLQGNLSIPILHLGNAAITAISANAVVDGRVATLALAANFSGAPLHATGTVNLTDAYEARATLSTGRLELGPLLTAYVPGTDGEVQCQTEVHASLRGPLKDWRRVQADIEIPAFRLAYRTLQVTNTAPIDLGYESGTIVLKPVELKGAGTDFHIQGTAPLASSGPIRASASGTIDLHLLKILYPDWDSSGQIQLKIDASGSRGHPNMQGQVRVLNATIEPPNAPIGVHQMNASIKLAGGRAEITSFTAQAGGGSVSASGFLTYNRGLQFNLALQANTVRIRYPAGVREVLDSNLRMTGAGQNILISGQVSLDRVSLTPSFDVASFTNQFNVVSAPAEANSFASRVRLSIAVRSAHTLSFSSSQLNLRGVTNLRLQGTLANPVVVGRATLSGGELFFNGARYRVVTGAIDFVNPAFTEPVINVRVATTIDQYDLTVNFTGPFDRLRTTYTSDPPLPPADIISLLLTGQTGQAQNTGLGAQSILTQGLTSQFSNRIQKLTGLSSLTIDPGMGNRGRAAGARIAVQERVTRNLYFTFSVDVATTQDDMFQLEYNLSRKWSVEATRDQAGNYSLEVKAHKTF